MSVLYYNLGEFLLFFSPPGKRRLFEKKIKTLKGRQRAIKSYYSRKLTAMKNQEPKIGVSEVLNFCKGKISDIAIEFLKYQLRQQKNIRWSKNCKDVALSFYLTGPRLYRCLRKVFKLPSKTTLSNYIKCVKAQPGISPSILEQLKSRAVSLEDEDKQCVLLLDEMSLRNNLEYNRGKDQVFGTVDFGDERTTERAESVLVAMLRGFRLKWKQPVFFFSRNRKLNPPS